MAIIQQHNITICEIKSITSTLLIWKKLNVYISLTEQYTFLACIFNSPLQWSIKPFWTHCRWSDPVRPQLIVKLKLTFYTYHWVVWVVVWNLLQSWPTYHSCTEKHVKNTCIQNCDTVILYFWEAAQHTLRKYKVLMRNLVPY